MSYILTFFEVFNKFKKSPPSGLGVVAVCIDASYLATHDPHFGKSCRTGEVFVAVLKAIRPASRFGLLLERQLFPVAGNRLANFPGELGRASGRPPSCEAVFVELGLCSAKKLLLGVEGAFL